MDIKEVVDSIVFNASGNGANRNYKTMRVPLRQRAGTPQIFLQNDGDSVIKRRRIDTEVQSHKPPVAIVDDRVNKMSSSRPTQRSKLLAIIMQLKIAGQWQIDQLIKTQIREASQSSEKHSK